MSSTSVAEVHRPSHGYSVAVVEDDPRQRARLAMQLSQHRAAAFGSLAELDEKAWPSGPLVVVLGPSFANVASVRAIANGSLRQRPGVGVVLVAEEVSTNLLHESMRA
ncbi:MAG: hypothetical protein ACRD0F_05010, partial [Acidimicrobiales bacterium]